MIRRNFYFEILLFVLIVSAFSANKDAVKKQITEKRKNKMQSSIFKNYSESFFEDIGEDMTPDEIMSILEKKKLYQKQKLGDEDLQDGETVEDSILEETEIYIEEKPLSVYENILRKNIIHPDDLLDSLQIFGYSVFNKRRHKFVPGEHVSVPDDYTVSPGDEIIVTMWGRINDKYSTVVDRDGFINLKKIGPVRISGKKYRTVEKELVNRIQNIEGVKALISMGKLQGIRIYIIGAVNYPGQYIVNALDNVTNCLFKTGGFEKDGSMRNVQVKRNGKTVMNFDFYDFLKQGNSFSNFRLKTDDVIFVPIVKKMAAIVGNVRQGALYELERKTTLKELISLAGGLTPTAWNKKIQVERFSHNEYQTVLDLKFAADGKLPDFEIHDGDIVKIFPVIILDKDVIYLMGNVQRPGKYQYHDRMKIGHILLSYNQLLPETYLIYSIIIREELPTYSDRIISFNLENVIEDSSSKDNISLKPRDRIIIFHRDYFEPDRKVSIHGAVTKPGTYDLLENMTIKDLILVAGGLDKQASLIRGELYKRTFFKDSICTNKIDFKVKEVMKGNPEYNITLSKFDEIYIRSKKGWEERKIIDLVGEFNYPGKYIVLEKETLGDVIRRAGGFKPEAYLTAAILTRETVKELEKKRKEEYIKQLEIDITTLSAELAAKGEADTNLKMLLSQQQNLLIKLRSAVTIGRVVIDFTNEKNYQNLQIVHNDVLYVPKNTNTVSVIGEVFNPATFVLDRKDRKSIHYVQQAGGLKEQANKDNIYIIKANGSVRTKKMVRISDYELESGDAVVVPRRFSEGRNRFRIFMTSMEKIIGITTNSLLTANAILSIQSTRMQIENMNKNDEF